jgi:hypothetical protein
VSGLTVHFLRMKNVSDLVMPIGIYRGRLKLTLRKEALARCAHILANPFAPLVCLLTRNVAIVVKSTSLLTQNNDLRAT